MNIFKKLFCKHKWITHNSTTHNWTETQIVKGTEHWLTPKFEIFQLQETVEVMICSECGAVKKISY